MQGRNSFRPELSEACPGHWPPRLLCLHRARCSARRCSMGFRCGPACFKTQGRRHNMTRQSNSHKDCRDPEAGLRLEFCPSRRSTSPSADSSSPRRVPRPAQDRPRAQPESRMRGKSAQQGEAIGQHRRGSLAQLGRCTALTRPLSCPWQLLGKHNYLDELPSLDPALHKSSPRHGGQRGPCIHYPPPPSY